METNRRTEVTYDEDVFHNDRGIVGKSKLYSIEQCDVPGHHQGEADLRRSVSSAAAAVTYRFSNRGHPASVPVFMRALDLLSVLYASQRLPLPLRGVLLVGY